MDYLFTTNTQILKTTTHMSLNLVYVCGYAVIITLSQHYIHLFHSGGSEFCFVQLRQRAEQ